MTPSPEGWPTKAKEASCPLRPTCWTQDLQEAPSPHEIGLTCLWGGTDIKKNQWGEPKRKGENILMYIFTCCITITIFSKYFSFG